MSESNPRKIVYDKVQKNQERKKLQKDYKDAYWGDFSFKKIPIKNYRSFYDLLDDI